MVEQFVEIAVENVVQTVNREIAAKIRDSIVADIVGPDLLRPFAGTDLAAPILRDRVLLLAQLHLVQPCAQDFHRLCAVLDLRFFVLLRHHDSRWNVRDSDRRVRGIDALSSGPARAERVDAQVLGVDLHVHFFGFR